jgi:putative MATE family efflux protein
MNSTKSISIPKELSLSSMLKLTGPVMLSQATVFLCGLTDLIFIKGYGSVAISAVSIANVLSFTLSSFLEGLRTTTTVFLSKSIADDKKEEAGSTFSFALLIGLCVGLIFLMLTWPASNLVFQWIGKGQYLHYGKGYLFFMFCNFPLFLLFTVMVGYFHGVKDTQSPLIATLIIGILNAVLDAFFIKGFGSWAGLGVPGSALATLVSHGIGLSFLGFRYYRVLKKKDTRSLPLKSPFHAPQRSYLKMCGEVGFYTGLMNLALFFFVGLINRLGPDALASHQITMQVFLLTYLPGTGFMVSATILLPALQDENDKKPLLSGIWQILKPNMLMATLVAVLLEITAPWIARFFLPGNPVAIYWTTLTLRLVGFNQILSSVYLVFRGTLTALRETKYIALMGLITGYIIFLPLAYLFTGIFKWGIVGGYTAFLCWTIGDVSFLGFRIKKLLDIRLPELLTRGKLIKEETD